MCSYSCLQSHKFSNLLLAIVNNKRTTQSYRQPVYYVDLTLREGVDLQSAIHTACDIDRQSTEVGFNQEALDQVARQVFANARFETDIEDGLNLVEEFYSDENQEAGSEHGKSEAKTKVLAKSNQSGSLCTGNAKRVAGECEGGELVFIIMGVSAPLFFLCFIKWINLKGKNFLML